MFCLSISVIYWPHNWAICASLMVSAWMAAAPALMAAFGLTTFIVEQLAIINKVVIPKSNFFMIMRFLCFSIAKLEKKRKKACILKNNRIFATEIISK